MYNYYVEEYIKVLEVLHPSYVIVSGLKIFKYEFFEIDFEYFNDRIHKLIECVSKCKEANKQEIIEFKREIQLLFFKFSIMNIQDYDFEYYMESHLDSIICYLEEKPNIVHSDFLYFLNSFDKILEYMNGRINIREINCFVKNKYISLLKRYFTRSYNIFSTLNIDKSILSKKEVLLNKFIEDKYIINNNIRLFEFDNNKYNDFFKFTTGINLKTNELEKYLESCKNKRFDCDFILKIKKWEDIKYQMPLEIFFDSNITLMYLKSFKNNIIGKLYSKYNILNEETIEFMHEIYPGHHYSSYLNMKNFYQYKFLNNIVFEEGWAMFIEYCNNKTEFYIRYKKLLISSIITIYINKYNMSPKEVYKKILLIFGNEIIDTYNVKNMIFNAMSNIIQSIYYVIGFEIIYKYFENKKINIIDNNHIEELMRNKFKVIHEFDLL